MMRAYTLKILQNLAKSDKPLEDKEIIAWVNEKVGISPCWQKSHLLYRVSEKTPKTIENDLSLEFQCLALN